MYSRVLDLPNVDRSVVSRSITNSSWTMHLAKRVCNASRAIWVLESTFRPRLDDRPAHRRECRCGVYGEERIVEDDKVLEERRSRNGPWLVASFPVVCVQAEDRDDVDRGEGEGYPWLESEVVEVLVNAEGCSEGSFLDRRWQRLGQVVGEQAVPREGENRLGDVHLRPSALRHG